jgi:hypothetical protein
MRQQFDRMRNLSGSSRRVGVLILVVMAIIGVIAFFTSELGRNITLVCCGLLLFLIVAGALSERGMRR